MDVRGLKQIGVEHWNLGILREYTGEGIGQDWGLGAQYSTMVTPRLLFGSIEGLAPNILQ